MEAMLYKPNHEYISEEQFNEVTLKTLKENKEGITEYPVLDFDERALDLLSSGIKETLKSSKVKVAGGKGYEFLKRLFDFVGSCDPAAHHRTYYLPRRQGKPDFFTGSPYQGG